MLRVTPLRLFALALTGATLAIFAISTVVGFAYTAPTGAMHFEVWQAQVCYVSYPESDWPSRRKSMVLGAGPMLGYNGVCWWPRKGATFALPLWMPFAGAAALAAAAWFPFRGKRHGPARSA